MISERSADTDSGPGPDAPPLIVQRVRTPYIAEQFCIYPAEGENCCAICYVEYGDDEAWIDIRSASDEKWYFYSLTEDQRDEFFQALIREMRLELFDVTFQVGSKSYEYEMDEHDE